MQQLSTFVLESKTFLHAHVSKSWDPMIDIKCKTIEDKKWITIPHETVSEGEMSLIDRSMCKRKD